ncbi:hypothetical protein niasHT_037983 [Heterodera trifolii]|uniref:BTB domain-containing protein n=1 Tax=Heterodera trifolii TaxID=157864 RepID=A0ABD2HQK8_9BILA
MADQWQEYLARDQSADETFHASVETADNGQQQQQANNVANNGSQRAAQTNGVGFPNGGDDGALRFVPERTRIKSRINDETDEWAEREEMMAQEDQMMMLKDPKHKDSLLSRLDTFRRNRAFCDVVLFVDGRELLAHKAVLAAISPPLFDLFHSNSASIPIDEENEHTLLPDQALELAKAASQVATANANRNQQTAQQQQMQIPTQNGGDTSSSSTSSVVSERRTSQMAYFEFPEADFDSLEALVEFAYTARLRIGSRRVKELYRTAFALQVSSVAQACAHWLAEHLTVSNCIGIHRQANLNKDAFLLSRVNTFIRDNFEAVVGDSSEFAQLPCIKSRIIVSASDGGREFAAQSDQSHPKAPLLPSGDELALRCLRYFQHSALRAAGERVDAHIESLAEKTHLLVTNAEEQHKPLANNNNNGGASSAAPTMANNGNGQQHNNGRLQDANELDEKSMLGSCDLVRDYKRSASIAASGKKLLSSKTDQQSSLHVMGATPIKLNGADMGRLSTKDAIKFASCESLCSVGSCCSNGSIPSEGIAGNGDSLAAFNSVACRQIICVLPTAPGFWVCLALLFHRLVRISIHLSEDEELIRSSRTSSVASSTDGIGAESDGSVTSTDDHGSTDGTVDGRRPVLPALGEARCAIGAAFLDGKILISGGYDRNLCLRTSEELDICGGAEEWRQLAPMCCERARFDAAVVNGKVFAVCGSNGNNDLSSCECFDPTTGRWNEVCPLEPARSHNGCASLSGLLYCIGGSTDHATLGDCRRYDPATNEWREIAPLKAQRSQAGCTAWRGLVVCVGGCDKWNCLDSVEAYDPQMDQWRHLARLRTPRRGCAVAVLGNSLFAIGGHDGHNVLATVEVLDSPNAQWRPGPSMQHSARVHHHAISAPGIGIFVVGGFDGTHFLASMEVMESEENGWHSSLDDRKVEVDPTLILIGGSDRSEPADDEPKTASTTPTPRG